MASFTTKILAIFKADTRNLDKGTRKAARGFKNLKTTLLGFGEGLRGMNTSLARNGALLIAGGLAIRSSLRHYERFSRAQTNIRSALATNNNEVNDSTQLLQQASALGRQYAYSTSEVAEGLASMVEMGLNTNEMLEVNRHAVRGARAANIQLGTAIRLQVDTQRQFGMNVAEAARVLPMFTIAARANSTSVEEAAVGMRFAGTEAAAFGFSAEGTIAALAGLSRAGLRTSRSGTSMRRIFVQMVRAASGMNRQLTEMIASEHGATRAQQMLRDAVYDSTGNVLPFEDAITNVANVIKSIQDPVRQDAALFQTFGMRGLAAAEFLSRVTSETEDWRSALRTLRDPAEMTNRINRTLEESMKGFHIQVKQLKGGLEELGVVFGEELVGSLGDNSEAFGSYFRDIVLATRYTSEASIESDDLRDRYRALTPEMRKQGVELRETLKGLATLIKYLAKGVVWVGKFVGSFPKLTASLIGLYVVVKPIVSLFGIKWVAALAKVSFGFGTVAGSAVAAGAIIGAVIAGLALGETLGEWTSDLTNTREEFDKLGVSANKFFGDTLANTPIIGAALRTLYRGLSLGYDMLVTLKNEWMSIFHEASTTSRREERYELGTREAIQRGSARRFDAGDTRPGAERQADVAQNYLNRSLVDVIAHYRTHNISVGNATEGLQSMLRTYGATEEERSRLTQQFTSAYTRMTDDNAQTVNREMTDMGVSIYQAQESLLNFSRAAAAAAGGMNIVRMPGMATVSTGAQSDVAVQSTGFLPFPVSAGDMLIDRSELANAMGSTTPGSMIPGSNQRIAGTPQSTGPTELKITIESPIRIDGREVARAIGRHVLQINQRRGAETRPGSRRRVAEQGVS